MAISQASPMLNTSVKVFKHTLRAVGGTTSITKVNGPGMSVSRTGTGAYRITWSANPGNFLAADYALQAATPANLAGHTVVFDEPSFGSTSWTLDFVVYNSSFAAHDLAASEWVMVHVETTFSAEDL